MATRTIVTSQPDVACDVCARRLLRGEHADVFVDAGRRRLVCELCAPRAAHAGWLRETDSEDVTVSPARPRTGGLFERLQGLLGVRRGARSVPPGRGTPETPSVAGTGETSPVGAVGVGEREPLAAAVAPAAAPVQASYNPPPAVPGSAPAEVSGAAPTPHSPPVGAGASVVQAHTTSPGGQVSPYLQEALDVFNASEFPRRVAGVIRSLGPPLVTVRSAEHLASVVRIVAAWELCWYCYEVDLSEPVVAVEVIAQGAEFAELAREDRLGNAVAADSGELALAGGG